MTDYKRHKQRAAARARRLSLHGRDIAPLPPIAEPTRRARAGHSFRIFCETYFPEVFSLPWSQDHLKVIEKIETAVRHGGLFAVAMPRGSGKTSLCKAACLWAALYGHRDFIALIGSSESHAQSLLHDLKIQLETNPLLAADFPEVCYPIAALEGIANRCRGQLYHGKRTHIEWTADKIVLPTIPGSPASGVILTVAGITGQIRGMTHQRPDGKVARPSLVIIDDPQTDESARSPSQSAAREAILAGAILGLAGPKKKIAGIMPCTVIYPGDMADNILNREKHPEWNGERLKMVYAFPKNQELWNRYAEIRAESLKAGRNGLEATDFYRKHRQAMDEGAIVAWPERYNEDEISAIQHAMNLKLLDEPAFFAEYQNDPKPPETNDLPILKHDVTTRLNRIPRGTIPTEATAVTAFIDIHQKLLYYAITAWADGFTGWIVEYGTYPPQRTSYYHANDARPTLADAHPGLGLEGHIYAGLAALTEKLFRTWPRENGQAADVDQILIDAGWGQTTDVIFTFCRQSPHAPRVLPSFGRFIGASATPMSEYRKKPGERVGPNWRMPPPAPGRPTRYVIFDANWWKTFLIRRLLAPMGTRGAITLYGDSPTAHRLLADHLNAETPVEVSAKGRTVTEWKLRPSHPDNHFFDCLVGTAVAASMVGIRDESTTSTRNRRKIDLTRLQSRA